MKKTLLVALALGAAGSSFAQVFLPGASFSEDFDSIDGGLPEGWSVYLDATSSSLGTPAAFNTVASAWDSVPSGFRNSASATGLTGSEDSGTQAAQTDRAIGLNQALSTGDPGAAIAVQFANTTGFSDFSVSISAQMLSAGSRTSSWSLQYGLGASPTSFTEIAAYADPGAFGAMVLSGSLGAEINDQSEPLWIRFVTLDPTTGGGSYDTLGLDNFTIAYSTAAVPEPHEYAAMAGVGLIGFAVWRRRAARKA